MPPLTRARAAAEAPSLLDALARTPVAAALVVGALGLQDRRALRLVCTQLRDAVGEATTKLEADLRPWGEGAARPPTPQRWPRLKELKIVGPNLVALEALGSETWDRLHSLCVQHRLFSSPHLDVTSTRALAAALRRMPALRSLELWGVLVKIQAARELFCSSLAEALPQLRSLTASSSYLNPGIARALAATGWRLEELSLSHNDDLDTNSVAAIVAAPTFALRQLELMDCSLTPAALLSVANASWPLEELYLSSNDLSAAAAALAALSRHVGLRCLSVSDCDLSLAGFRALIEATWPALTYLSAQGARMDFVGSFSLGPAAFAGFPALKELDLSCVGLGGAGARLLASRRWEHLRVLKLIESDAGLAALARGTWPALEVLHLNGDYLGGSLTLEDARRWAPALVELLL